MVLSEDIDKHGALNVPPMLILSFEVLCRPEKNRPWDAARDVKLNRHDLRNQQTKMIHEVLNVYKIRSALQKAAKIRTFLA